MESVAIATWTGRSERDTGNAGNSPAVLGVVAPTFRNVTKQGLLPGTPQARANVSHISPKKQSGTRTVCSL